MGGAIIEARGLGKTFRVPVPGRPEGFWKRLGNAVFPATREHPAVQDLSFDVARGEILGFLGANGSGKSTTVKMLTGILTPSAGRATVLGFVPHRDRREYTRRIGVVFGQKSLLWWNIPVLESLKLYRDIYGQDERVFERRLRHFAELLEVTDYLHVPVRKLSLGMRMRSELVASLLHEPEILFLDEPTIGLDVLGRRNLKQFLQRVNEEEGVTLFLTTHNMFDVEDLCRRCLILRRGEKIYDGGVADLKDLERHKVLEFQIHEVLDPVALRDLLTRREVMANGPIDYRIRVPTELAVEDVRRLFECCRLGNLNILPPSLESVVEKILERDSRSLPEVPERSERRCGAAI